MDNKAGGHHRCWEESLGTACFWNFPLSTWASSAWVVGSWGHGVVGAEPPLRGRGRLCPSLAAPRQPQPPPSARVRRRGLLPSVGRGLKAGVGPGAAPPRPVVTVPLAGRWLCWGKCEGGLWRAEAGGPVSHGAIQRREGTQGWAPGWWRGDPVSALSRAPRPPSVCRGGCPPWVAGWMPPWVARGPCLSPRFQGASGWRVPALGASRGPSGSGSQP